MTVRRHKAGLALRYALVVVLAASTQLASLWFHSSGVYRGPANNPLRQFPGDVDFFFIITFAATVIAPKYVLYELAVRAFIGTYKSRAIRLIFYAGYTAALGLDMAAIFSAAKPTADAGFAILAAVFQTPMVLIGFAGAILGIVLWKDRPSRDGASQVP